MVLRRLVILLVTAFFFSGTALAQEAKPLLVGGERLEAVYPGNFGVSYTDAKPYAQALGLSFWEDDARLILGLGSVKIRLPVSSIPKSKTALKKLITSDPPSALRDGEKLLVPVKYIAKSLGCIYSGSQSGLRVDLPSARLVELDHQVIGGRDVVSLRFDREVNLVRLGPGHWLLIGAAASEGLRPVNGLYLSDVRLLPGGIGTELYLDGASNWPEEVAYYPQEARIYVGPPPKKAAQPPLIVIDPGHGGADYGARYGNLFEKDIVLKVAKEAAARLRNAGYRVELTRDRDEQVSIYERAQRAARADVFVSLHVAGSPLAPAGPGIYTYTGSQKSTPVFTEKSRRLLSAGGYKPVLLHYAAAPQSVADFSSRLGRELGRIGLTARRGQTPLYLLERAPGASVLLELGAINNTSDRARMTDSAQQSAYAQVIVRAIEGYLGGAR